VIFDAVELAVERVSGTMCRSSVHG